MASIQIEKIAPYDLDRKKNQFNFKQIIQILQPIFIEIPIRARNKTKQSGPKTFTKTLLNPCCPFNLKFVNKSIINQ